MAWTFDEKSPIYLQIAYRVKLKIASKELSIGQQLLPVRELAQEAGVNPNTVQRAFQELEKEGLVYSARTSGRFVTEDEKLIDQKRHEIAQNLIKNFVTEMMTIGFSSPKIKTIITDYIEQTGKEL
ncbi:MAG: GntR family transcriptional regulator [Streptococcus salivarius]|jgi:transcriptional regulator, gntR family, putative|uniref:GntR family transcriptional regulator n=1 Tax=Streptococcus salivarius TaxID=1304 RepID=A0AB37CKC4_STRSL|nr:MULTISPECIES: GntR family transcriptional regulator [Streptococcus]MBS7054822.1 GntR family transcriptional regulator [Streptococcus salivarius]MCB5541990.1 GntR family transcriptional regulator [Streptococcus salivarius]MCB5733053.1 GntR family transcriptional regulator [Streptococcus sp. MSK15_114]MDU2933533.1 GntR family transcriptional regulator [Streptococcus salivarius]MDU5766705.1 GntR family transcriptional regulator [Streptococcus salivarius]